MHVQRIHYSKLVVIALILMSVMLFVFHRGELQTNRNTIDVELYKEASKVDVIDKSTEESLAIARVESCPVCFGEDLCTEIKERFLTVSIFGEIAPYGTVYQGRLNDEDVLSVLSPHTDWWDSWDRKVCRNVSQGDHCNLGQAARTSFLSTWPGDPFSLRHLHSQSGHTAPSALTACITANLALALRKSFDVNHDGALSLQEKSSLVTTVGVSPGLAVLRLAGQTGLTSHLPRYIGCCGRLAVMEGGLSRLEDEVRRDWSTRAELAGQVFALLETFLSVEGWVMVAWGLSWSDFSLSRSGQLVFTGLDKLSPVDKTLLEPPSEEDRPVCNSDCFSKFKKDVMMRTPRGQPGLGCGAALLYADMMYRDVCTNILSDQEDRLGLLHSAPTEEISRLVKECAVEEGRGGRWRALDHLKEMLSESGGESEETSTESSPDYSTERGSNNTEQESGEIEESRDT